MQWHALALFALIGCSATQTAADDVRAPVPRTAPPPTAGTTPAPTDVSDVADPCAAPFPADQLAALANDPGFTPTIDGPGNPERVAMSWGHRPPQAYIDVLRRYDGMDLSGPGGRVYLWRTETSASIAGAFMDVPVDRYARELFPIGGGEGVDELWIDIDDFYGKGRCAVFLIATLADDARYLAPSLPAAFERILRGPAGDLERMTRPPPAPSIPRSP